VGKSFHVIFLEYISHCSVKVLTSLNSPKETKFCQAVFYFVLSLGDGAILTVEINNIHVAFIKLQVLLYI